VLEVFVLSRTSGLDDAADLFPHSFVEARWSIAVIRGVEELEKDCRQTGEGVCLVDGVQGGEVMVGWPAPDQ